MPDIFFSSPTDTTDGGNDVWVIWNSDTSATTVTTSPTGVVTTSRVRTSPITSYATSDNDIWVGWNQDTSTTGSGIVTYNNSPATTDASSNIIITRSTTDSATWNGWNNQIPAHVLRRMDPEERARREAQEREWERQRAEAEAERRVANEKAERLLLSALSEEQRREYLERQRFHVHTPDGRIYRINKGWAGNVNLVPHVEAERGEIIENLCIHPTRRIPECDNMLAQKLMIEHSEPEFRQIANISRW